MFLHSGSMAKENHESWESLFRRTLSKEQQFTFTRSVENPVHWMQFLDSFDQQGTRKVSKGAGTRGEVPGNEKSARSGHVSGDKSPQLNVPEAVAALAQAAARLSGESCSGVSMDVPGWPLIPFSNVRVFKCEKCNLEFCSPVNHRRHLRMIHRRPLHVEKEDRKSLRQQFATFWDKLSPEEAYKIVAVKNLQLEDLTGGKVARALTHLLQQPSLFALPHSCVRSGAMLLELVQSRSPRIHLTSSELFEILDGSSEKTFPSFGLTAMQRYIFEGGAGKVGLETKNLVASLSFLVEHNLVKAFIKDKDEEAWRCQAALVEEEEASQRKRAQIQARKCTKKFRQKDKEQKASDLANGLLSDSDTSDDGSVSKRTGLQSRPSSNMFENLDHKMAGEGSDLDACMEVVSTAVSSPSSNTFENLDHKLAGEGSDLDACMEVVSTVVSSPSSNTFENLDHKLAGEGSDLDACMEVVSTAVSSPYDDKSPMSGGLDGISSISGEVGMACKPLEDELKDSSNLSPVTESSPQDSSVVQKPYTDQKCKSFAERSLSFRREASPFPYQKQFWKERKILSARNDCKQIVANEIREDAVLSNSCFPRVDEGDPSVNQITVPRPMQYVAKPVQLRNYKTSAQLGAAVWAKKMPKCADASASKNPESIDDRSLDFSDAGLQPDGCSDSSVGVSSTAATHDKKADSVSISSITVCPTIEYPPSSPSSKEQVYASSGAVVIGSFNVPLDSAVAQKEAPLVVSSCKDSMQTCIVVDASEREHVELVEPAVRTIETNKVPLGIGVINHVPHKEPGGDGKLPKIQSDTEWKGSREHSVSQAGIGNLVKPIVVQGEGFAGAKVKVWRPVGLDKSIPDNKNKVSSNQSPVIGGDINSLGLKELEIGQTMQDNSSLINYLTSDELKNVAEDGSALKSDHMSTFKAMASFLSQRWSEALNTSGSVILSAEDEEGWAVQGHGNTFAVQIRDTNNLKDSKDPSPTLNREGNKLLGNDKKIHKFWKQGCSGSAMAVNKQLTGKDNLHSASRFTCYRYVPK